MIRVTITTVVILAALGYVLPFAWGVGLIIWKRQQERARARRWHDARDKPDDLAH